MCLISDGDLRKLYPLKTSFLSMSDNKGILALSTYAVNRRCRKDVFIDYRFTVRENDKT